MHDHSQDLLSRIRQVKHCYVSAYCTLLLCLLSQNHPRTTYVARSDMTSIYYSEKCKINLRTSLKMLIVVSLPTCSVSVKRRSTIKTAMKEGKGLIERAQDICYQGLSETSQKYTKSSSISSSNLF